MGGRSTRAAARSVREIEHRVWHNAYRVPTNQRAYADMCEQIDQRATAATATRQRAYAAMCEELDQRAPAAIGQHPIKSAGSRRSNFALKPFAHRP